MAVSISERTVRVGDHDTLLRESPGDGVPLLLIHAISLDSRMWLDGVFEQLATHSPPSGASRRVIAYDMRGHGRAMAAPLTSSMDQLADDARELLRTLGIDKIDICGVSFGGAVAQAFMFRHPECVRSALLVATLAKGVPILEQRATEAEEHGVAGLRDQFLPHWFTPAAIESDAKYVRYAREMLGKVQVPNWAAAWRAVAVIDYREKLKEVKVPALFVASGVDKSTPPAVMKPMCEAVSGGEYKELTRGLHLFVMEFAEEVAAELKVFLSHVEKT
jgi:3-oxoadipate enol-lactonase